MYVGPFHLNFDISAGTVIVIITILWRFHSVIFKMNRLYDAFYNGANLGPECFFAKFHLLEQKVEDLWNRK